MNDRFEIERQNTVLGIIIRRFRILPLTNLVENILVGIIVSFLVDLVRIARHCRS